MSFTQPTPVTWTLRFKRNKVTVVLHVDPMKQIDELKENLLNALRKTEKDHKLEGKPLPEDFKQILLGKPISTRDLSKGWVDIYDEVDSSTGKLTGTRLSGISRSLKALGIKDNAVLAFRFGSTERNPEQMDDGNHGVISDEPWNVVIPSYNDADDAD